MKYRNGTTKRCSANGEVVVSFQNGDTKTTSPEGTVVYFYAAADTTHTTDEVNGIRPSSSRTGNMKGTLRPVKRKLDFRTGP